MIDLHVHTNCSDGTDDYLAVFEKAEAAGLSYLSITDHDTCHAYIEMKNCNIKDHFTGNLIRGVELQALVNGIAIELLGYGIDIDEMESEINKIYLPFHEKGMQYMTRLYNRCIQLGMRYDEDVLEGFEKSGIYYPTLYLHGEMVKHTENRRFVEDDESWAQESVFFRKHTSNPDSPFYIEPSDLIPAAELVAETIRKTGGIVFIPHIFQYGKQSLPILKYLIDNCKIDGIECYYSTFTKNETSYLLEFCKKHKLFISAGSDYHGSNRPGTQIGTGINGNLCVSDSVIQPWIESLSYHRF